MTFDAAKEIAVILVPVLCAVITVIGVRQSQAQKRLRGKYKTALYDLLAFYKVEHFICESIATKEGTTTLAVKRRFRSALRKTGVVTPSDKATEQQITSEILRL